MTDPHPRPPVQVCGGDPDVPPRECLHPLAAYPVAVAQDPTRATRVHRYLPATERRLVSTVCLLDRVGPLDVTGDPWGLPAHPHLGLQTITYVLRGRLQQRDSLGNDVVLGPGEFSLFDSGEGASHLECSPPGETGLLDAIQLWLVLPGRHRDRLPRFTRITAPSRLALPGLTAVVVAGNLAGVSSSLPVPSAVVAAVVEVEPGAGRDASSWLPLHVRSEYAILPLEGEFTVDGEPLTGDTLYYLGCHRDGVELTSGPGARFLLIGGEPFTEEFVLWWNLAAPALEDLVSARTLWNAHSPMFGTIAGRPDRATTPPLPPLRRTPAHRQAVADLRLERAEVADVEDPLD